MTKIYKIVCPQVLANNPIGRPQRNKIIKLFTNRIVPIEKVAEELMGLQDKEATTAFLARYPYFTAPSREKDGAGEHATENDILEFTKLCKKMIEFRKEHNYCGMGEVLGNFNDRYLKCCHAQLMPCGFTDREPIEREKEEFEKNILALNDELSQKLTYADPVQRENLHKLYQERYDLLLKDYMAPSRWRQNPMRKGYISVELVLRPTNSLSGCAYALVPKFLDNRFQLCVDCGRIFEIKGRKRDYCLDPSCIKDRANKRQKKSLENRSSSKTPQKPNKS